MAQDVNFEGQLTAPPLTPIGPGAGLTIDPGEEVELVPAAAGRVRVVINHAGDDTTGWLWIGYDHPAVEGDGDWLEPGGRTEEFFAGAVRVLNAGDVPLRATFVEWAAS